MRSYLLVKSFDPSWRDGCQVGSEDAEILTSQNCKTALRQRVADFRPPPVL